MATNYLTCNDTAKLVRQSLKEAFPGVKFSVRGSSYSGGASITVRWMDGPNTEQVEAVAKRFHSSYFDGSIDHEGSIFHMLDGEQVHFGANYIHFNRDYSDRFVQAAIERIFQRYLENFKKSNIEKPTCEQWRNGGLWSIKLTGLHDSNHRSLMDEVNGFIWKHSDRLQVKHSKTAAKVFATHDDGFSAADSFQKNEHL